MAGGGWRLFRTFIGLIRILKYGAFKIINLVKNVL